MGKKTAPRPAGKRPHQIQPPGHVRDAAECVEIMLAQCGKSTKTVDREYRKIWMQMKEGGK
jgi:hypothetical protein